jgi:hypothetical protein
MAAARPPGSDRTLLGQIYEVLLAEAPLRLGARRQRLRQRHRDARLVAFKDLRSAEVSAIGNHLERLSLQDSLRLLGNISKLRPIRAAVRHLMCHNQMMFGVDSHLNIVADDTGAAAAQRVFTQPGSNPDRLAGACECRHGALEVARTAHGR